MLEQLAAWAVIGATTLVGIAGLVRLTGPIFWGKKERKRSEHV